MHYLSAYLEIDISQSIAVIPHGEYCILVQNNCQVIIGDQVCLPIIIRDALNDNWLIRKDDRFPELSNNSILKNKLRFVPYKTFTDLLIDDIEETSSNRDTSGISNNRDTGTSRFHLFLGPDLTLELTFDSINLANILYERSSSFGGVTPPGTPYSLYERNIARYIQIAMIMKNHEKTAKLTRKEVLSFTQFKYLSLISGPIKRKPIHPSQRLSAHF